MSSFVDADVGQKVVVQGFRTDTENGYPPVVYMATVDPGGTHVGAVELTLENANILGEYLRQAAEFATADQAVREKGE